MAWSRIYAANQYLKQEWPGYLTAYGITKPRQEPYDTDITSTSLRWRHNGCDSVLNHQPHQCLLNRLFRRRSKKTSKLRVTGLCAGNSAEFPAQMASYAENASIWWRHHGTDHKWTNNEIVVVVVIIVVVVVVVVVVVASFNPNRTQQ